jgi:uncharacterized protein YndB with AHSA1/START domain
MSVYQRARVELVGEIPASAADAWDLLNDWAGILRWWPANPPSEILRVELDGDPGQVPRTRVITLAGGAQAFETLLKADPVARRIYYDMKDGGMPILRNYVATTVIDAAGDGRCLMGFSSNFDVLAADESMARAAILAVYGAIRDGFQQYFAGVSVAL